MSERVTFAILAVLALCVMGAFGLAWGGQVDSAKDIILAIANMLGGAIGGWSAHKAIAASMPDTWSLT